MPLVDVHFDIGGDTQFSRAFELYAHEAGDLSDPFEEIADSLLQSIGRQFETEGAGSGRKWAPLNPAYERWKESHWPGRPILVRSGDMRGEMLDRARTVRITPDRMTYDVADPKAVRHQQGEGHLPQRRMVDLTLDDRRGWDRILATWLNSIRRGPLRPSRSQ